jgi:lambda family phage portal protein
MKRSLMDKFVGFFSPLAELKRIKARGQAEYLLRSYDAAVTYKTDDWTSATRGSANQEIRGAQDTLRAKGRDAVRNNPYAGRALNAIVANTVGAGIMPNIKGKTDLHTKRLNNAWREWAETTACDSNGKHNFYSMQSLALRSTVEAGEVIALKEISAKGFTLRLLESDYIVTYRDSGSAALKRTEGTIQGVKTDKDGTILSYYLFESHPGEVVGALNEREVNASDLCHIYRQDRPGQLRGVTWFHPVIRALEDFNQLQQAMLISRKVAACFAAFITTNDADSTLSKSDLAAKRQNEMAMEPAMVRYLEQGENVEFAVPPMPAGYDEYARQILRSIATGVGISYEALTTDYSNVNFSSGRMGYMEFRRNVEIWRWNMLIPQFCEPAFEHFLRWCLLTKGIQSEGVIVEWVPPAWTMIDPTKEVAASKEMIRAGLTSWSKAVREQGHDPEQLMQEIADDNRRLDELKISLDSDPRKLTGAGLLQIAPASPASNNSGDTNSETNNQAVPPNGNPSQSDQ